MGIADDEKETWKGEWVGVGDVVTKWIYDQHDGFIRLNIYV